MTFKNISLTDTSKNITVDLGQDNNINLILNAMNFGEIQKEYVLIKDFRKKYQSWDYFIKYYGKIVIKDVMLYNRNFVDDIENETNFPWTTDNQIILSSFFIDNRFKLLDNSFIDEHGDISKQQWRIWCALSINHLDELVIKFVLSGIVLDIGRIYPFELAVKFSQLSIEKLS